MSKKIAIYFFVGAMLLTPMFDYFMKADVTQVAKWASVLSILVYFVADYALRWVASNKVLKSLLYG